MLPNCPLLFDNSVKNMSMMSLTYWETTVQEIKEPGLLNCDHMLAQPFAGKFDWAFIGSQRSLCREEV